MSGSFDDPVRTHSLQWVTWSKSHDLKSFFFLLDVLVSTGILVSVDFLN